MKLSKKLAAALAICALSATSAMAYDVFIPTGGIGDAQNAASVAAIKDGAFYLIYDAHNMPSDGVEISGDDTHRYSFKYDNGSQVYGTHVITTNATNLELKHVWKAKVNDDNTYSFQNAGTQRWIQSYSTTGSVNNVYTTTDESVIGKFNITQNTDGSFKVYAGSYAWDGLTANYKLCTWTGTGHPIQFYEVSPANNNCTAAWNVNVTWPDGVTQFYGVVGDGENLAFPHEDDIYTTTTYNFENVHATVNVPLTYKTGVKPFRFVSARYLNRWATTGANGITTVQRTDNGSGAEVFLELPLESGRSKFYSRSALGYFAEAANNANPTAIAANADAAGKFLITKVETGAETFFSENNNGFNYRDGHVAGWNGNDIGSRWFMVYDLDSYNANVASYSDTDAQNAYYTAVTAADELKSRADLNQAAIRSAEYAAFTTTLNALKSQRFGAANGEKSIPELLTQLTSQSEALETILASTSAPVTLHLPYGDSSITINIDEVAFNTPVEDLNIFIPEYMGYELSGVTGDATVVDANHVEFTATGTWKYLDRVGRILNRKGQDSRKYWNYESDGHVNAQDANNADVLTTSRLFVLRGHIQDNAMYVSIQSLQAGKNVYLNVSTSANNNDANFAENEQLYKIVTNSNGTDGFSLQCAENVHLQNYYGNDNIGVWVNAASQNDISSFTQFFSLTDADWAALEADLDSYKNNIVGTGAGKYSSSSDASIDDIIASIEAVKAAGTYSWDEVSNVLTDSDAFFASLTLNEPESGFYRFRGINDDAKYLSSVCTGNKIDMVADANVNKLETVYYYDAETHRLVALSDGLVLSDYNSSDQGLWHNTMASNTDDAGYITFGDCPVMSRYTIEVDETTDTQRYIYNKNAQVDCGSSANNEGYYWELLNVEWLPIPGSNHSLTTFYSPVSLALKEGVSLMAYSKDENGKAHLNKIEGATHIPANTPVILHFDQAVGGLRDENTKLVYLQVVSANDVEVNCGDLQGGIYTAEGSGLQLVDAKFVASTVLNGFEAYVNESEPMVVTHAVAEELLTPGKIYSIRNADASYNRGFMIYKEGQEAIWSTGTNKEGISVADATAAAANPENVNYHWMLLPDNSGNYYLYNLGAKKFAAAYTPKDGTSAAHAEFAWHFADTPTAVQVIPFDWLPEANAAATTFNIIGGQNSLEAGGRPAGMMTITGDNKPIVGIAGVNAKDGCGYIFTEVSGATVPEDLPGAADIESVKEEMAARYAQAAGITPDDILDQIGAYAGDGLSQFFNAFNGELTDADTESQYYALMRAHNAVTDKAYNEFENEGKYTFMAGENTAYKAVFTLQNDGTYVSSVEIAEYDEEEAAFNWLATVNENGLTLAHGLAAASASAPAMRRVAGEDTARCYSYLVQDAAPAYDGLGNVELTINGAPARMSVVTLDESKSTTGIEEVTVSSNNGANAVYDLQGRRLSAPVKGINIINGKKVLVK